MTNPYDLGRSVGKQLATALLEATGKKRIVAVYAGRYAPFHPGHYSVYKLLVDKFGSDSVFVGTSNKVEPPRSPFSFADKKKIITTLFGIPSSKIVQVASPFKPTEILSKFDPKTTAFVTAFSQKDAGRLGGKYFKPLPKDTSKLLGYEDAGYFIVAPELAGVSGTLVRSTLADPKLSLKQKQAAFEKWYGKFDKGVFDLMLTKLGATLKEQAMISRVLIQQYQIEQWRNAILKDPRRRLLLMGGFVGHLRHPFEDMELTFADLKQLVNLGLSGKLNVEAPITEKLDGQNIGVSYRADRGVIFARNKSHLKNAGQEALTVDGIKQMFAGRGDVSNAFSFAAEDLASAVSALSASALKKIFLNGKKFMSMEIIYPATQNVIPYGLNLLVFHGTTEYDVNGEPVGQSQADATTLAGLIKKVNAEVQKHFTFRGPVIVELPKVKDFTARKGVYLRRIQNLQGMFKLRDSDQVIMWHQRWWEAFITEKATSLGYAPSNSVLTGLIKRWAYNDTGAFTVAMMKKEITNKPFLDWALTFDKQDHEAQAKRNISPFEGIFLELGAEILQNARGLISVSPGAAAEQMRKSLDAAIKELEGTTDVKKLAKFKEQMAKLNALGLNKLVPSEGIVVVYKGRLLKFTGTFAPIGQILGSLKY